MARARDGASRVRGDVVGVNIEKMISSGFLGQRPDTRPTRGTGDAWGHASTYV